MLRPQTSPHEGESAPTQFYSNVFIILSRGDKYKAHSVVAFWKKTHGEKLCIVPRNPGTSVQSGGLIYRVRPTLRGKGYPHFCSFYKVTNHDIGKAAVDETLLKKPFKLTEDEFNAVKAHAPEGAKLRAISGKPILRRWQL